MCCGVWCSLGRCASMLLVLWPYAAVEDGVVCSEMALFCVTALRSVFCFSVRLCIVFDGQVALLCAFFFWCFFFSLLSVKVCVCYAAVGDAW